MPEDDQYDRNMQHIITKLIKFGLGDGNACVNFNMLYHNRIN
jgi:hypothetical protein